MLEGFKISETIIQIFASVGFVTLGAAALTIASAISGFSIFREHPAEQARIIVLGAGAILFILSPLGYLIFYPKLFSAASTELEPQAFAMPLELWGKVWSWRALLPFGLGLVGFGLMYGAIEVLGLREMLLLWLRERTGIGWQIIGYQLAWDRFLSNPKKNFPLIVNTKSKTFIGRIAGYSIRQESREIRLRDFIVLDSKEADQILAEGGAERLNPFRMNVPPKVIASQIWIDGSQIESMSAPTSFFKRHQEHADHVTQGSYLLVAAVGILLMVLAAQFTDCFLLYETKSAESSARSLTAAANAESLAAAANAKALHALHAGMSAWYGQLATVGLVLALVLLGCASTVPVREYTGPTAASLWREGMHAWLRAAKATYGMEYRLVAAVMIGVGIGGAQALWAWSNSKWLFGSSAILALCYGLLLICTGWLLLCWRHGRPLREGFENYCDEILVSMQRLEQLNALLDELYFCLDVNFEAEADSYASLRGRLLHRKDGDHVAHSFFSFFDGILARSDVAPLAGANLYEGNEFNVIAGFRRTLRTKLQLKRAAHPHSS